MTRRRSARAARRRCAAGFAALVAATGLVGASAGADGGAPGGTLLVANKSDDSLSFVDLATGATSATLATGRGPHEVAVSPDGRLALVSNYGSDAAPGNTLSRFDVATATPREPIDLSPHARPHGLAWLPDGRHVLVTAEGSRTLVKVDAVAGGVVDAIDTRVPVHMVALGRDARFAFATSIEAGAVVKLDLHRGEHVAEAPTDAGAEGIAVTPDGRRVWVTNRKAGNVTVLDADTLELVATLAAGSMPIRVAFTGDGRYGFVVNALSASVGVYSADPPDRAGAFSTRAGWSFGTGRVMGGLFGALPVPVGILVAPGGDRAYVANSFAGRIAVFRLPDGERLGSLEAGAEPDGLALSPLTPMPARIDTASAARFTRGLR